MKIKLSLWKECNCRFAEKLLSEFTYEQLLVCHNEGDNHFYTTIGEAQYKFRGRINIWGQPIIVKDSIFRIEKPNFKKERLTNITVLLKDLSNVMPCSNLTWSQYSYECMNTLYSDYQLNLKKQQISTEEWLSLPPSILQTLFDSHPKALPNKGRIGWGAEDLEAYAPEHQSTFRLRWVALHHSAGQFWHGDGVSNREVCLQSMDELTIEMQYRYITYLNKDPAEYYLLPVHPWQWSNFIVLQFSELIANHLLIDLGFLGDSYLAQLSLRTLSNISRPEMMDIKLPITVLNTSSYRGLTQKYLSIATELSNWLHDVCEQDDCFSNGRVRVQKEPYSAFVPHPFYSSQENSPYQYQEMLGAVWRESAESKLYSRESIYMASSLHQFSPNDIPIITYWIRNSLLSVEEWLTHLFDCTAIPLWHWQCAYGLGFISHGQNLNIIFENMVPTGIVIKDIQGDLFVSEPYSKDLLIKLPEHIRKTLPKMPPHYLIHNLWTGYFASVLRFASSILHDSSLISEENFWLLLSKRLRIYQDSHPQLRDSFARYDLFQKKMPRLCINRARLSAGYGDSEQRPVHSSNSYIYNPLFFNHSI